MRGSAAAISSATAPVPSGDPSSTIRTSSDGSCERMAGTICETLSRSLYVGTITSAFSGNCFRSPLRYRTHTSENQCGGKRDQGDHLPLLICGACKRQIDLGCSFG